MQYLDYHQENIAFLNIFQEKQYIFLPFSVLLHLEKKIGTTLLFQ